MTAPTTVLDFIPDALAASQVGTWEWTIPDDVVLCCAVTAGLFGVSADEGLTGLPFETFSRAMHPEDRERIVGRIAAACERGGAYVFEYRTTPSEHEIRWVIARGRYEADGTGRIVRGCGVVIDVTDRKRQGAAGGSADAFAMAGAKGSALERVADLLVSARRLIEEVDPVDGAALRPAVNALLMAVGRRLATTMTGPPDATLH